jgi:protein-tyrosine-phosphatase
MKTGLVAGAGRSVAAEGMGDNKMAAEDARSGSAALSKMAGDKVAKSGVRCARRLGVRKGRTLRASELFPTDHKS